MKKKLLLSVFLLGFLLVFTTGNLMFAKKKAEVKPDVPTILAHISYVDKGVTVIRQDKTEEKAVVNLPIVPGDHVVTNEDGRCEVQFDNGSIVRLDKNSRLKVTTIQAPMLTSKWTVTTLHLMRGQIYSMHQSYDRQLFQVITPNAAIDMKKRSATTIKIKDNGDTFLYGDKGKVKVMYGKDVKNIRTAVIKKRNAFQVTSNHKLEKSNDTRNIEFVGWNQYVNRHFEDLHHGISKVPKKIYRYNKGLVYWAEKWSSLYGEWVYDDLFGYVWKPADEIFAFSKRPFFHAGFTKINGTLYLVPQQKWGWAPAHMGTWVWMKWGWTWVPSDAFTTGIRNYQFTNTLDYWMRWCFGSYRGYYDYLMGYGYYAEQWRADHRRPVPNVKKKIAKLPVHIRKIIKKMNRVPVAKLKKKFGSNRPFAKIDKKTIAPYLKTVIAPKKGQVTAPAGNIKPGEMFRSKGLKFNKPSVNPGFSPGLSLRQINRTKGLKGLKLKRVSVRGFRDFNPDIKWGRFSGHVVGYSSRSNAIVAPGLKLNSRTMSRSHRAGLGNKRGSGYRNGRGGGNSGSGSSSTTSDSGSTGNTQSLKGSNQK